MVVVVVSVGLCAIRIWQCSENRGTLHFLVKESKANTTLTCLLHILPLEAEELIAGHVHSYILV